MSDKPEKARALARVPTEKMIMPVIKIRRRPIVSASLPIGTRKTAVISRKAETVQPRVIALSLKSAAMEGRAKLVAELIKGVRKEARVEASRINFLSLSSCMSLTFCYHYNDLQALCGITASLFFMILFILTDRLDNLHHRISGRQPE